MTADPVQVERPIVLAVATAQEQRACGAVLDVHRSVRSPRPVFLRTGTGPLDIDALVEQLTQRRASALVSIGTAGGLAPTIKPGTVLIPKRIRMTNGRVVATDAEWQAAVFAAMKSVLPADAGDLLSVPELIRHPDTKRALHDETRAVAVDMESGQLATAAERAGVRFLALRAIMDAADDVVPVAARIAVAKNGDTAVLALLRYLLKHPGDIYAMGRIVARFRNAAGALSTACESGGGALLRSY